MNCNWCISVWFGISFFSFFGLWLRLQPPRFRYSLFSAPGGLKKELTHAAQSLSHYFVIYNKVCI